MPNFSSFSNIHDILLHAGTRNFEQHEKVLQVIDISYHI